MKSQHGTTFRAPVKFRMPTADNLVPIRLDIELDGQRYKDAFTWNPSDSDSEIVVFAKRTVKDLKLPPGFASQIAQSIQASKSHPITQWLLCNGLHAADLETQLTEFRSYEGQDMFVGEKVVPIKLDLRVNHTLIRDHFLWDLTNMDSDPEEFARSFCVDMNIEDPEVAPAIAFAIREQLYEIAVQNVTSAKEIKFSKKSRRGIEYVPISKAGVTAVDLMKLFGSKSSVIRKRKDWDVFEPIVDILSNEEVELLEAREDRIAR